MSLDIWVGNGNEEGSVRVGAFEPEAFYHFVHPLLAALRDSHGKYIDLYDDCEFRPGELVLVERLVTDAERLVHEQAPRFRVHTGTQTHPVQKELYADVTREACLAVLTIIRSAVDECRRSGKSLYFYGD